jgi:hypothetical protein
MPNQNLTTARELELLEYLLPGRRELSRQAVRAIKSALVRCSHRNAFSHIKLISEQLLLSVADKRRCIVTVSVSTVILSKSPANAEYLSPIRFAGGAHPAFCEALCSVPFEGGNAQIPVIVNNTHLPNRGTYISVTISSDSKSPPPTTRSGMASVWITDDGCAKLS